MNSFGQIIGILVMIIFLFFFPILYTAQKQDSIIQEYLFTEATVFIDNVRTSGRITKELYDDFIRRINTTQIPFHIELEHSHKVINPIYNSDHNIFLDSYSTHYYKTYLSDILDELYEGAGNYRMSEGDLIYIKLRNKSKTMAGKLQSLLYSYEVSAEQIIVTYGGMIRNEDY